MKRHDMRLGGLAAGAMLLASLSGCSTGPAQPQAWQNPEAGWANTGHRHLILASIPGKGIPTSSVARARINVALMQAKRRVDERLCNGDWTFVGNLSEVQPPEPSISRNGGPAWKIALAWAPRLTPCKGIDRSAYFLAMSRELPAWVKLHEAGGNVWYQAGRRIDGPHLQLAEVSLR